MHEDDLSDRLIEKMRSGDSDADQWMIIRLPAPADDEHDLLGRAIGELARAFRSCRPASAPMPSPATVSRFTSSSRPMPLARRASLA